MSKDELTNELVELREFKSKIQQRQTYYSRRRNAKLVIMYKRALENNVPEPTDEEIKKYMSRKK